MSNGVVSMCLRSGWLVAFLHCPQDDSVKPGIVNKEVSCSIVRGDCRKQGCHKADKAM